jgi:nucleotide-binding universal stress UspA family protein
VLARSVVAWAPLAPADVERGWQAEAARLRTLAERAGARHEVGWSMRVVRGALDEAALALRAETDLLLVAGAPAPFAARRRRQRPHIVALDNGEASGRATLQVAAQLAQALGAKLETRKLATQPPAAAWAGDADLLVLPADALAALPAGVRHAPLLLVGAPPRTA